MDTPQAPQPTKPTSRMLWVVLLVLVLAVAGYGIYAYIADQGDENANNSNVISNKNTNGVSNSNSVQNANSPVNINTAANSNANGNVNATVNANSAANSNTNIDTTRWKTYVNDEYGYSFRYPSDMNVADYSQYNSTVYGLKQVDDKIIAQAGGAIPIYVQVFDNTLEEVKTALKNKDENIKSWSEITIDGITGEYSEAVHVSAFSEHYYVFSYSDLTLFIKTTDPNLIIPTFAFTT